MHSPHLLGILGGLGPMASAYFYEMITEHTLVQKDQEHIDIILSSRASTPDRTDFILGKSLDSPLPAMIEDAKALEGFGARAIVIPCNTAHYFIDEVRKSVTVPVPSIIKETAHFLRRTGKKKAGILATAGTVFSGAYQTALNAEGVDFMLPDEKNQAELMHIIYDLVKKGLPVPTKLLYDTARPLTEAGCDALILGCTELSVAARGCIDDPLFVDSLMVLAYRAITMCEKKPKDFPEAFALMNPLMQI